jgi:hypothetical protein
MISVVPSSRGLEMLVTLPDSAMFLTSTLINRGSHADV